MEPRLLKLARLGVEPDAIAILEKYGKTLPRDIKLLDEKALAEMKLNASKLGRLNARRIDTLAAIEAAKGKAEPEPKPALKATRRKGPSVPVVVPEVEEVPLPAPAKPARKKAVTK